MEWNGGNFRLTTYKISSLLSQLSQRPKEQLKKKKKGFGNIGLKLTFYKYPKSYT